VFAKSGKALNGWNEEAVLSPSPGCRNKRPF